MSQFVIVSPEDLQRSIETAVKNVLSTLPQSQLDPKPVEREKREIFILPEAADYCRMPVPTFREYLARNEIRGAKIGRSWRFLIEDLDQFIQNYRRKTNADIEKKIDDELSK